MGVGTMEQKTIRELMVGDFFTLKPSEEPHSSVVWVRGPYDRGNKKFLCYKFEDVMHERYFKAHTIVWTGFTF